MTVRFAGQRKSAVATGDGKWMVRLDAMKASAEGRDLTVDAPGGPSVILKDVLVGEVWVASGQSNMEYGLVGSVQNGDKEAASANFPLLRLYTVATVVADAPAADVSGQWQICTPATAAGFSGFGYLFGRDLQQHLGVPVGIVHSSVSGTLAEAWTSWSALEGSPELTPILQRYHDAVAAYPAAVAAYHDKLDAWQASADAAKTDGKPVPAGKPAPPSDPAAETTHPGGLFNGKIAPLIPLAMRGVIWWQGEYNSERCEQYKTLFPTLIGDWRKRWRIGDFPFFFVQLQNLDIEPQPNPAHYDEMREAQLFTFEHVPNTGMAIACDVGDANNIHPPRKQPVAERMLLCARALAYGEHIEYSGPIYRSMEVHGREVHIHFSHTGGGLASKSGESVGSFEIAATNRVFRSAQAKIDRDSVIVSSTDVAEPVSVRYAWKDNPVCTLYNGAGLPASPFRTDDWPLFTTGKR